MPNLLQSSQNKTTTAPSYYTDYLTNLATEGTAAAKGAEFVGAQPLQTKAFEKVCQNFGNAQPAIATGQGYVGQAAGQDVTGAAAPYLSAATSGSPLDALDPYATSATSKTGLSVASPYLEKATGTSPADLAAEYMNPYLRTAVQSMSDIANRNIRQNLSPMAAAAAVGSGQFGSQRGAQVQGQITAQAQQDLNNQIAQMMAQGYGQALCAAGKQNALTSQAGQTAGALQEGQNRITSGLGATAVTAKTAENQANLTAANTAAQAAASEGNLLNQAGQNMGTLATQGSAANLACINALSTLGAQEQTIKQNEENFPLDTLIKSSGLLQGYNIPVGTKTTVCASPLSVLAGAATGTAAFTQPKYDSAGKPIPGSSGLDVIKKTFGFGGATPPAIPSNTTEIPNTATGDDPAVGWRYFSDGTAIDAAGNYYKGGELIWSPGTENPADPNADSNPDLNGSVGDEEIPYEPDEEIPYEPIDLGLGDGFASGGPIRVKAGGYIGCASTKYRGGLPYKKG